jgi:hypothetical protein
VQQVTPVAGRVASSLGDRTSPSNERVGGPLARVNREHGTRKSIRFNRWCRSGTASIPGAAPATLQLLVPPWHRIAQRTRAPGPAAAPLLVHQRGRAQLVAGHIPVGLFNHWLTVFAPGLSLRSVGTFGRGGGSRGVEMIGFSVRKRRFWREKL